MFGLLYYHLGGLMSVFSVKLRKDVKGRMDRYKGRVNWADEVRRFTEDGLRVVEAEDSIRRVVEELSRMPLESPRGSSVASVREDRESR
jgi:hypothetical protein